MKQPKDVDRSSSPKVVSGFQGTLAIAQRDYLLFRSLEEA